MKYLYFHYIIELYHREGAGQRGRTAPLGWGFSLPGGGQAVRRRREGERIIFGAALFLPRSLCYTKESLVFSFDCYDFRKSAFDGGETGGNGLLYPMKLKAPLKDYLWGGTKLKTEYHKETALPIVAESWELSCHPAGPSVIMNGPAAGMELSQYIAIKGERVIGAHAARYSFFPILIKLIDAASDLSLQVHPDTEYALRVEGQYGKTEFWYVVECAPEASLICGFTRPVTKEEVRQRIADQTLLEICRRVPVHPGDVFYIPAGLLHSIGGGITLVEVQQASDVTYRVYDYGRLDKDGKPRPLHVEKALDVLTLTPQPQPQIFPAMTFFSEYEMRMLAASEFFTVYHVHLHGRCSMQADRQSFHSIVVLEGLLEVEYRSGVDYLEKGTSLFVPADYGAYHLRGFGSFILSMVP